jgi:hypothetical protein
VKISTKTYEIDNCIYDSKPLVEYLKELKELKREKLIKSFSLPQNGENKKTKFHAYKVVINNITFDSLNESRFYIKILKEQKQGLIKSFELQKRFEIIPAYIKNNKKIRKAEYLADFVIHYNNGSTMVIDIKGIETDVFKLKKKLVEYMYPEITIQCYRYVSKEKCWKTLEEIKNNKKLIKQHNKARS